MSESEIISGVQCLLCNEYCSDKSGYNKHHDRKHLGEKLCYRTNAPYRKSEDGAKSNSIAWNVAPVPDFTCAPSVDSLAGPGLFERQTKFISKGKSECECLRLFQLHLTICAELYGGDAKWACIAEPTAVIRNEATDFVDKIDEFTLSASHAVRQQIMRSKSGLCKSRPFQSLKGKGGNGDAIDAYARCIVLISLIIGADASGYAYAMTLARFIVFARIFLESPEAGCLELLMSAMTQQCTTSGVCCIEGFLLCLCEHAPLHFKVRALCYCTENYCV